MGDPTQTRKCVACGRDIQWDANVCPYCGHDYRQTMAGTPMAPMPMMPMMAPPKPKTVIPLVAGIMLIVVGIIWMIEALMLLVATNAVFDFIPFVGGLFGGFLTVLILIGMILAVIVLLGGVSALMRKHAGLAFIGAIFGLFAFLPLFIPSVLSLVALILLAVSHHEFD
jgi:hypothetical protein